MASLCNAPLSAPFPAQVLPRTSRVSSSCRQNEAHKFPILSMIRKMIGSRPFPAILLMVGLSLWAEDPSERLSKAASDLRAPDCFVLLSSPPGLRFNWFGEDPLSKADFRELRRVTLGGETVATLNKLRGGPGWVLFDPTGILIDEGSGIPNPAKIRERMEKCGWSPLRESLRKHLNLHPEDGQARVEFAFHLARQGRERKYAGTLGLSWIERLRGELLPELRALSDTPGLDKGLAEAQPQPFGPTVAALRVAEMDKDPEIGDAVKQLFSVVPKLLARDPESRILWSVRKFARREGGDSEDGPALLASMEGVPGSAWPPHFLANHVRKWYRNDPTMLAEVGRTQVQPNLHPSFIARWGLPHVLKTLETWGELHLEGLLLQGKFEESLAYLNWMRLQTGRHWPDLGTTLTKVLHLIAPESRNGSPTKEIGLPWSPIQKKEFLDSLSSVPLPDPILPSLEPLRLVLLDGGFYKEEWGRLRAHPALATWDASELIWTPLKQEEERRLIERYEWPSMVRWVLLKGDQVLASQAYFPTIDTIQNALTAQGPCRLDILNAWIKSHPDRMDGRRTRMDLVRSRIPNPDLERVFLDDLEALEVGPGPLRFKPNPDLWEPSARRIASKLAERISHWPFNEGAWKAYVEWSYLFTSLPRPSSVLDGLETFPRQLGVRLPGPIPAHLCQALVKMLEEQERFQEVDAWMQIVWDRGLKSWLRTWSSLPQLAPSSQGGWFDQAAPDVRSLLSSWGKSMEKTGRVKAKESIRWELDSIKPGLGMLLGMTKIRK